MMTTNTAATSTTIQIPPWQPEKHLHSGDKVWLLTDIDRYFSSYYAYSAEQELFKVGAYDLLTNCVGFVSFGRDMALSLLKAGVKAPPWTSPLPYGIALHRAAHGNDQEKGRYKVRAVIVPLEPDVLSVGRVAQKMFARESFYPNATSCMWSDLEEVAQKERAVEAAVELQTGTFKAGDIKALVGKDVNVTPVLQRLVEEGYLLSTGKKKGTIYQQVPGRTILAPGWNG